MKYSTLCPGRVGEIPTLKLVDSRPVGDGGREYIIEVAPNGATNTYAPTFGECVDMRGKGWTPREIPSVAEYWGFVADWKAFRSNPTTATWAVVEASRARVRARLAEVGYPLMDL